MNARTTPHNRVLFVDDEEGVRVSWNRYLTEQGISSTETFRSPVSGSRSKIPSRPSSNSGVRERPSTR